MPLVAQQPEHIQREPDKEFNLTKLPANPDQSASSTAADKAKEIPILTAEQLLANPQLLEQALYASVVQNNIPAVRQLLPLYQTLPNSNDKKGMLLIQVAQAKLFAFDGQNKEAIRIYRDVLSTYPQMQDIRFFLVGVLIADQQNEAAEDQILRLRTEKSLPATHQQMLEHYLALLKKRETWQLNGSVSYAYDPNINNAPKQQRIYMNGGVWTFSKPESAHGISYYAEAKRDWNLQGNYYATFSGEVSGKSYWSNHNYDDLIARPSLGLSYKNARTELMMAPYYQKRWAGNKSYTYDKGVRLAFSHWLSPKHQLSIVAEGGKEVFKANRNQTGQTTNLSATWLFVRNANQYWTIGFDYADKNALDRSRAYQRYGFRASWTQEWQKGLSTALGIDVGQRQYGAKDIFQIQRKEREYSGKLSIWHRNIHFLGITPRLTLTYRTTNGNHPVYEYRKLNGFIQFNKQF